MIIAAGENPAFAREVLDRTEGKVAQELIQIDGNRLIEQLEAARQRVLQAKTPQATIEGVCVNSPNPLETDTKYRHQATQAIDSIDLG